MAYRKDRNGLYLPASVVEGQGVPLSHNRSGVDGIVRPRAGRVNFWTPPSNIGQAQGGGVLGSTVVTTQAVTGIASTSATGNGTIISAGRGPLTEVGVCWSTHVNPTTADSTAAGTLVQSGSFTAAMTGLTVGTAYHVRAYGTNASGTSYGSDMAFSSANTTYPNQPAGLTVFAEHNFSAVPSGSNGIHGSWWTFQGGGTHLTLQTDATAPQSPTSVLQVDFEIGTQPGFDDAAQTVRAFGGWDAGSTQTKGNTEYSEIYESLWMRIPTSDFEMQQVGAKLGAYWGVGQNDNSHVANQLFCGMNGNGSSNIPLTSFTFNMFQQNIVSRSLTNNIQPSAVFTCGSWHQLEVHMKLNSTLSSADGLWEWWLDGVLCGHYTDVVFNNSTWPSGFWGRWYDPPWGGAGGTNKTRTDNIWLDHMYISGKV